MKNNYRATTIALLASTILAANVAHAADAPAAAAGDEGTAIIVTGTRTVGMKAVDSPAPIQVLGSDLLKRTGQPDLIQSLAQNLPQIQAQAFGSDLAAHNLSMKLRGLSPNHTLILVNGKRRHGSANVNVSGGPYGGGAAPDISFVLADSVDHVEVLQDGAAAQYGTDAIAGVINFIQKKADHGGSITATGGQYMDGGGRSLDVSGNIGIAPVENMYLNISAQTKFKDYSFRGDVDPRVYGSNTVAAANLAKYPALTTAANYPYANRVLGDPKIRQTTVAYNAGYTFGDFEVYSFGSFGKKIAYAYENYRTPATVVSSSGVPYFPAGFNPKEKIEETDYQVSAGFKGVYADTNFDLATQYSKDMIGVYVVDSANAELYKATGFTPSNFHDGDFITTMWDTTLDLTREFKTGLAEPLHVAAGLEFRKESYQIVAGDPASYYGGGAQSFFGYSPNDAGYHTRSNFSQYLDLSQKVTDKWLVDGAVRHEKYSDFGNTTVFKLTQRYDFNPAIAIRGTVSTGFRAPTLAESFYSGINVGPSSVGGVLPANSAGAAALGFGGLKPEKSTNFSLGFVLNPLPKLTITIDAYQTTIRDRIIISSSFYGFRGQYCPSSNYNASGASTLSGCVSSYNADNYALYNQSAVYNAVAAALGGTIPAYVLTQDTTAGTVRNTSGTVSIQTFANGVKMRTRGVDFLATYPIDLGSYGKIDWSLAMNYNDNKVLKIAALPSALYSSTINPTASALISRFDVSQLQDTTPKFRATLGAYWKKDKLSVNLRESFYGASGLLVQLPSTGADFREHIAAAVITDLDVSYQLTKAVKFTIGANNLTNHYPTKVADVIRNYYLATGNRSYSSVTYPTFSPYGINGGYYYARVGVKF
ncbi:TonB-dependent receptor [Novosphingobium umbonatum]|uniref:TonB-dependent receptor n=1 Tax=Novosphingobium umbonatum TaxID=1908524 RepID=A0A437ND61_9SPHN|nr:TonB-dependent receptor [Novosphingobium umbonatum]RVU07857.1 TonB-dependent receptor [Novosphingobium umbonatum]